MGYKTPIVCKEVYLPVPQLTSGSATITFDDYLKEYGIDLSSLFVVVGEGDRAEMRLKDYLIKFYAVFMNQYAPCVLPIISSISLSHDAYRFTVHYAPAEYKHITININDKTLRIVTYEP